MTRLTGPHPAITAFLLGGGSFLALYFGWRNYFPHTSVELDYWNTDLMKVVSGGAMIAGILMWLAGGIRLGRHRGMHWLVALCLHLLPGIGIILILMFSKSPTLHEV